MSRQEEAFDQWKNDFIKLVLTDKKLGAETRRDLQANLEDLFSYPGITENMVQAFSNFMWGMDAEIERQVNNELITFREMIPSLGKEDMVSVPGLVETLNKIIDENSKPTVDLGDEAIDTLVDDDEFDNSRPPGL